MGEEGNLPCSVSHTDKNYSNTFSYDELMSHAKLFLTIRNMFVFLKWNAHALWNTREKIISIGLNMYRIRSSNVTVIFRKILWVSSIHEVSHKIWKNEWLQICFTMANACLISSLDKGALFSIVCDVGFNPAQISSNYKFNVEHDSWIPLKHV